MDKPNDTPSYFKNISGFDYFVLAGGLVNALVITYMVGYWLLYG